MHSPFFRYLLYKLGSRTKTYIHSFINMSNNPKDKPIKVPRFHEKEGFYTTKSRSYNMSKIKGKNTKPELMLRKALWREGIRFRIHVKDLPGKPDIALKKYKLAIFVDGEFWHGKDWEQGKNAPKSNKEFWVAKIERNMQLDRIYRENLEEKGYVVFRFWTGDIRRNLSECVKQILLYIETAREIIIPPNDQ